MWTENILDSVSFRLDFQKNNNNQKNKTSLVSECMWISMIIAFLFSFILIGTVPCGKTLLSNPYT